MSFSGALQITDLNDFIGPSTECIKPNVKVAAETAQPVATSLSLADCLACSGCVTSAETVLVESQSPQALSHLLTKNSAPILFTIHRASLASLTAALASRSPNPLDSTTPAYRDACTQTLRRSLHAAFADRFAGLVHTNVAEMVVASETLAEVRAAPNCRKPLLASACPGFVCYAEKAQGAWILPHIISVQSPQALMGTVVRRLQGSTPLLHIAIAPCFDKKLEASRSEFAGAIDMVISSAELLDFLNLAGHPLSPPTLGDTDVGPPQTRWEARFSARSTRTGQPVGLVGASGGLAHAVRRALLPDGAAAAGDNDDGDDDDDTTWQRRRQNRDFQTSGPVAIVNGFRSMQTLIRLMRTKRSASKSPLYEFVEVMACPSGCLNGGGQVRDEPLQRVQAAHEAEGEVRLEDAAAEVPAYSWLYRTLAGVGDDVPLTDLVGTNAVRQVATTTYRDVKTESTANANPLAIQW